MNFVIFFNVIIDLLFQYYPWKKIKRLLCREMNLISKISEISNDTNKFLNLSSRILSKNRTKTSQAFLS